MHREEYYINSDSENPEMYLTPNFIILISCNFSDPIIKTSLKSKYCTHGKDIMEMTNYIISIMKSDINRSISLYNSSETTESKEENESNTKQHGCKMHMYFTSVHCCKPREYFNTCRLSNNHSCTSEISSCVYIKSYRIHMMTPNLET
jgi:hypothetical protein